MACIGGSGIGNDNHFDAIDSEKGEGERYREVRGSGKMIATLVTAAAVFAGGVINQIRDSTLPISRCTSQRISSAGYRGGGVVSRQAPLADGKASGAQVPPI